MATYIVEFVGGPFDGHRQPLSSPPVQLVPQASLPVSSDEFRLFEGQVPATNSAVTSIAFYEREIAYGAIRYRFVGARPPTQPQLKR